MILALTLMCVGACSASAEVPRFFVAPEVGGEVARIVNVPLSIPLVDLRLLAGGRWEDAAVFWSVDHARGRTEWGLPAQLTSIGLGGSLRLGRVWLGGGARVGSMSFTRATGRGRLSASSGQLDALLSVDLVRQQHDRALYVTSNPAFGWVEDLGLWSVGGRVGCRF